MSHSLRTEFALEVVRKLRVAGFEALWAGGCVRDLLLGHEPADYDVATSARPEQVREVFGRRRTLPVGISFGVVLVRAADRQGGQVEVATFRTDAHYSDGRHPDSVTFSNPQADAQRRDFTINGMFYDPLQKQVIDYVDGRHDLAAGLIRAIGQADDRLTEDKLRMLRAVRFAARFGFHIEARTWEAITRHAAEISLVSGERLWIEIRKTLESPRPAWGVSKWAEAGLLHALLPEVDASWAQAGPETLLLLEFASDVDWSARFGGLLYPALGSDEQTLAVQLPAIKGRLRLANDITDCVRFCLTAQPTLAAARQRAWSEVQPWLVSPWARTAVELLKLRARAASGETACDLQATAGWLQQQLDLDRQQLDPPPWLMGADLIHAGLRPGPRFKQLLERARALQLDQKLAGKEAALNWLNQQLRAPGD